MSFQVCDVAVRAGPKMIIEHISLSVEPGEIVAVVGPNGAGKSTLLRAMCGQTFASAGVIRLNNRPLNAWSPRQQAQMRAVLPQNSTLNFAFRVLEVVLMGRAPHISGVEQPRDVEIAYQALALVALEGLADRSYTTLSGGEQQRVQLARVLAQIWEASPLGSRYLLLDEPTNNLDLAHQHAVLQNARRFAQQGVGVFAILHDLNLAAQYADRLVILQQGHTLASGVPQAVLTAPMIEAAFNIPVLVLPHPSLGCPLVVANAPGFGEVNNGTKLGGKEAFTAPNRLEVHEVFLDSTKPNNPLG